MEIPRNNRMKSFFTGALKWMMGKGTFWKDRWFDDEPFYESSQDLSVSVDGKEASVADMWSISITNSGRGGIRFYKRFQ